jgi:hypothetical protein
MVDELDLIPLARAAALAHNRVFPGESVRDMKTLDLLALALSTLVTLYQRENEKDAPRALARDEVAAGRFTRGATRLERPGRPPLRFLMVARRDLSGALDALAKDPPALHRISALIRPHGSAGIPG